MDIKTLRCNSFRAKNKKHTSMLSKTEGSTLPPPLRKRIIVGLWCYYKLVFFSFYTTDAPRSFITHSLATSLLYIDIAFVCLLLTTRIIQLLQMSSLYMFSWNISDVILIVLDYRKSIEYRLVPSFASRNIWRLYSLVILSILASVTNDKINQ